MAAVAVARESVLFLKSETSPRMPSSRRRLLRVSCRVLEDALARLVVDDEVARVESHSGRRVLGVAAGVLVEAGAVLEEHVQEVLRS